MRNVTVVKLDPLVKITSEIGPKSNPIVRPRYARRSKAPAVALNLAKVQKHRNVVIHER